MREPQLFNRSSKAFNLAHLLAKRQQLTVAEVVERALELYANVEPTREAPADFYARISRQYGTDIDLYAVIREN